eukprot:2407471-Rhodomonas_salina.1
MRSAKPGADVAQVEGEIEKWGGLIEEYSKVPTPLRPEIKYKKPHSCISSYAVFGTGIWAIVLRVSPALAMPLSVMTNAIVLRARYAMASTRVGHSAAAVPISLRIGYALSGTDVAHAGTRNA